MILKVTDIVQETPETVTVSFKNGNLFKDIQYLPGQFIMFEFKIGKDTVKRAYSFSSSPDVDKDLKITVKKKHGGSVSNYINNVLRVGDKIKVDTTMGSFNITPHKDNKTQYVIFGAGSGITPIYSIIKSVITKEPDSKILLIYANKDKESIIFHDQLKNLSAENPDQFSVEHILTENYDRKYYSGFLTEGLLKTIFDKHSLNFGSHKYMMCGPSGFMENTVLLLEKNGVLRQQIMLEVFKTPTIRLEGKNLTSNVTIIYKKEKIQFEVPRNKTILEQAMNNNIALPYSCRTGICSTCKGTCTDGLTSMNKDHSLNTEQVNNGEVLTCVTYPNSRNVTIEIN